MKKFLRYLIFAAIAGFFIYLAFRDTKFDDLWANIQKANFFWVGAAWVAGVLSVVSRAIRYTYIVEPLGYSCNKTNSYHAAMIGYMVNFAIPRGGEISRAASISRSEKIPLPTVIGSIVAERVVDLVFMGLVFLMALVLQKDIILDQFSASDANSSASSSNVKWIVLAVLGIGFFVSFYFLKKLKHIAIFNKIYNLLMGFAEGIKAVFRLKKPWHFLLHSLFIWLMYFLMVYCIFFALPQTAHLGFSAGLSVLVMSTVAVVLPAPGGIGTFHFFVSKVLLIYGIAIDDGLAYATIAHASQMIMFVVLGVVSFVLMLAIQKKNSLSV